MWLILSHTHRRARDILYYELDLIVENKMFGFSNLSRLRIIKWLLDKLLTSLVTSVIIYLGPLIGLNFHKLSFGYIYTIITIATLFVSVVIYFLVPKESNSGEQK